MFNLNHKGIKSLAALALILVLGIFTGVLPVWPATQASAEAPILVITGTGLKEDIFIYQSDLGFNNQAMVTRYYSANDSANRRRIFKVKGFDLLRLFNRPAPDNLREGDWDITFAASDGFKLTFKISDLRNRFYSRDLTQESAVRVDPVIGIYRSVLYGPFVNPSTPITWTDRPLTPADLDPDLPRLHMGQINSDPADRNNGNFVKGLIKIMVGAERAQPDPQPQPPTPQPTQPQSPQPSQPQTPQPSQPQTPQPTQPQPQDGKPHGGVVDDPSKEEPTNPAGEAPTESPPNGEKPENDQDPEPPEAAGNPTGVNGVGQAFIKMVRNNPISTALLFGVSVLGITAAVLIKKRFY